MSARIPGLSTSPSVSCKARPRSWPLSAITHFQGGRPSISELHSMNIDSPTRLHARPMGPGGGGKPRGYTVRPFHSIAVGKKRKAESGKRKYANRRLHHQSSSRRKEAHSIPTRPPGKDQSLVTSAAT